MNSILATAAAVSKSYFAIRLARRDVTLALPASIALTGLRMMVGSDG